MSEKHVNKADDEHLFESFIGEESTVVSEEREKIFNEIERVIAENAREVTPDQFIITASRKGLRFPLIVNTVLVVLLVLVVSAVTVYVKRQRTQFLYATQKVLLTGSALVQSIIKENQAKVAAREETLQEIQSQLDGLLSGQQNLDGIYAQHIDQFKARQEADINNQLQTLQEKLKVEQLGKSEIQRRLKEQGAVLGNKYENKLASYIEQQNQEKLAQNKETEAKIDRLQSQQAQRQLEIDSLQDEISKREEELHIQQGKTNKELANAQAQLALLSQDKEKRTQALGELTLYYNNVTSAIKREDYTSAKDGITAARNAIIASPYRNDGQAQLYLSLYTFYERLIEKIIAVQETLTGEQASAISEEELDTRVQQITSLQESLEAVQKEVGTLRTDYTNEQQKLAKVQNNYDAERKKNVTVGNNLDTVKLSYKKFRGIVLQNIQFITIYLALKNQGIIDPIARKEIDRLVDTEPLYVQIGDILAQSIDVSRNLSFP